MLSTGFAFAARQFWKVTVNIVIKETINRANANIHQ